MYLSTLWLVTIRTSLKTKLPCMASRGSLEDRSGVTWEFLRSTGVLLHTLVTIQIAFLPYFSWQKCHHAYWILHTQWLPNHSGNSASVLRICVCCVHTHGCLCSSPASVQQASVKVTHASLLSHNSLPCVSSQLFFCGGFTAC